MYGRDQGDLLGTFTEVHKTSGGIGNVSVEVTLALLGVKGTWAWREKR